MNSSAFFVMAIPATVAVAGGALATLWKPSHAMRSLIQHFAAGSLFMYGLKLWTGRLEHRGRGAAQGAAVGLLVATFVDVATLVLFGGFLTFWAIQLMGH